MTGDDHGEIVPNGTPRLTADAERLVCAMREAFFSEGYAYGSNTMQQHERREAANTAARAETALREYILTRRLRRRERLALHATA